MKTDPNKACPNEAQRFFWAFVHDFLAHPLMAITAWSTWSLDFHDWTSHKAWPRVEYDEVVVSFQSGTKVFEFKHPKVSHKYVTNGDDHATARAKADAWFEQLSVEFGGEFKL